MAESASVPSPVAIPDHELLRPVGRGSYGEVWLARSVLGEFRAVKVVRRDDRLEARAAQREFEGLQKFEPLSRSHEGLVHVLHAGRFDGGFFYVMELADSIAGPGGSGVGFGEAGSLARDPSTYAPRTLRAELQRHGRLPAAECLELALKLTDALAHLHRHGLVHRDIKPSNIIFVRGQPKLADIGLVASTEASLSCVGTEGYLPPEGPGKPPADLFALGKVLYEISTGNDRNDFPELPTLLREDPQRAEVEELNEVVLKACDPHSGRRYGSAQQMRADLLLLHSGRSLRGMGTMRRRLVFARRAGALVGLFAVLAVGACFYQQVQTREARRLERAEAVQRVLAEDSARMLQLKQAEGLLEKDEGNRGVAFLARMLRQNPGNHLAAARLMSALNDRSFALPIRVFEFPEPVEDLEFQPDGTRFVTRTQGGTNSVARLWDVATGRMIGDPMRHEDPLSRARFSPDGRWMATAAGRSVRIWNAATGTPVTSPLAHPEEDGTISDIRFAPDSQRLVVILEGARAYVRGVPSGEQVLAPLDVGSSAIGSARFSPDGRRILTWSRYPDLWDAQTGKHLLTPDVDQLVDNLTDRPRFSPDGSLIAASAGWDLLFWDAGTGRVRQHLRQNTGMVIFDLSPDGSRVAAGDGGRAVRMWDVESGKSLLDPLPHTTDLWWVEFDPTGERLLTRELERARVWDSRTGRPLTERIEGSRRAHFTPDGRFVLAHEHHVGVLRDVRPGRALNLVLHHQNGVSSARFSASGHRVVSATGGFLGRSEGGWDNSEAVIWDANTGEPAAPRIRLSGGVESAEFSPDERSLVTVSATGRAQTWNTSTGPPATLTLAQDDGIKSAGYSPDGRKLATCAGDRSVRVWEARTGRPLTDPLTHSGTVGAVEFSPDGNLLLVVPGGSTTGGAAKVWDLGTGKGTDLDSPGDHIQSAHFSPDGRRVIAAYLEDKGLVWDVATGGVVGGPLRHQGSLRSARYSRDGRRLVTASSDRTARVWDAVTFQPVGEPMTHDGLVGSAAFSPDGRRVITCSTADHGARIWDAETGRPLTELLTHEDWATAGEFSPDGRRLLTASMDGTVRIRDLPPSETPVPVWLLDLAEAVAGHRLVENGVPEPVPAKEFLALKDRILASPATDPYTTWARWFLADRLERGTSFTSRVSAGEHRARLLDRGSVAALREALQLAPDDAGVCARLARGVLAGNSDEYPHPERTAAFLADYAARLSPDTLSTWWARAEALARSNRFPEALVALERATTLAPRSPELWRLKAECLERSGQEAIAVQAYAQAEALAETAPRTSAASRESGRSRKVLLLARARLLGRLGRAEEAMAERLRALGVPARDSAMPSALADLSMHYNLSLRDSPVPWEVDRGEENFASLIPRDRFLGGVRFDLRGAVLAGNSLDPREREHLADRVQGIRIARRCERLHFLHVIPYRGQEGVNTGRYLVHYEDGSRVEIPIVPDRTIGFWESTSMPAGGDLTLAWIGTREPTSSRKVPGSLYKLSWRNPKPHLRIESVDFEPPKSTGGAGVQAVVLVAITAQSEPTPVIRCHPQECTAAVGELAVFRVEAEAEATLAYQWQFNGTDLPGETNATLVLGSVRLGDAGTYSATLRNPAPDSVLTVTTESAPLIVRDGGLSFGVLRREVFANIAGPRLSALTNRAGFPGRPDTVGFVHQFESPSTRDDNYGVRLTGYLVPPETGEYRFYLCSDDEGALFLSTSDSPARKQLIAREPRSSGNRFWSAWRLPSKPEHISQPIRLEANRRYYVEALMKEGGGGDHLSVAWQRPGGPPPEDLSPPIPGAYLAVPEAEWQSAGQAPR